MVAGLRLADGERFNAMKFGIPATAMVAMVPIVISEEETVEMIAYRYTLLGSRDRPVGRRAPAFSIMLRTEG